MFPMMLQESGGADSCLTHLSVCGHKPWACVRKAGRSTRATTVFSHWILMIITSVLVTQDTRVQKTTTFRGGAICTWCWANLHSSWRHFLCRMWTSQSRDSRREAKLLSSMRSKVLDLSFNGACKVLLLLDALREWLKTSGCSFRALQENHKLFSIW